LEVDAQWLIAPMMSRPFVAGLRGEELALIGWVMGRAGLLRLASQCLMAAGWTVLVAACATGEKAEEEQQPVKRPVLVGRVASMPKDQDFVLLQSYGTWSVPPGTPVYCVGPEGRLANLLPTGEKMGQFVAADLRDGEVQVGDAVFYRPDGDEPAEAGQAGGGGGGISEPVEAPEAADDAAEESIEPELPR
jgi:hypothetical protein